MTDLRAVFRQILRAPVYAGTVVVTLAAAIGANSAIFGAVHAVLLRPLPLADVGRTVVVSQTDNASGQAVIELTYRHLREWRAASRTFTHSALVATHTWDAVLEGRGEPTRLAFAGASSEFFDALGVSPLIGRGFEPQDDVPNAEAVMVLTHASWARRFGADPAIVGQVLRLDGASVRVVGVMPRGLDFPHGAEFWRPAAPILTGGGPKPNLSTLDTVGVFYVVGRLRPGLDAAAAAREIDETEKRLDAAQPGRLKWGDRAVVETFRAHVFGPVQPALWTLWAAVVVLLLIACANVSGLLLTRVSLRERDQSVRLALGASRGQVARLWLLEVALLTMIGAVIGLASANGLASAIVAFAPDDVPRLEDIAIDGTVVAFTVVVVGVTALLCGLVPMRHASRARLTEALVDAGRATSSRRSVRVRSALLIAQMALAVVMLVAAGLVVRSFRNLQAIDLGFTPSNVLSFRIEQQVPQPPPNQFMHKVLEQVAGMPGVDAAGAVFLRPLALGPIGQGVRVVLEGQPETPEAAAQNPTLNYQVATPGFFAAMQVPLRRGRFFTSQDTADSPRVVVVSESTARRLWPGQDPLGRRVRMASFTPRLGPQWRTVVGVVSDVRYRGIDEVQLDIYDPALQVGLPARTLVVRAAQDPLALADVVKARVREMDPGATVDDVTTMEAVVARASAPWRMSMWLFVLFAGISCFLATIGLVSVVSLDVAHRRRELAVRLALGASRRAVQREVLARAAWTAGAGVLAGLAVAIAATRAMRALLYGVEPLDAVTYVAVAVLVSVVAALAAWAPSRRAATIDPMTLMRAE